MHVPGGQLASWKVTGCILVIHKLDMQAAADHDSHTHTHTYATHNQDIILVQKSKAMCKCLRKATDLTLPAVYLKHS